MNDSHERFVETGDLWRKTIGGVYRARLNETLEEGVNGTKTFRVWTEGEDHVHKVPPSDKYSGGIVIDGRRPTAEEVNDIAQHGEILLTSNSTTKVALEVDSVDDLKNVVKLPFVYLVEFPYDAETGPLA